ncbi:MAG: anaerobic ribonucleoside-triphosphate reductase activating protein [Halanaerobiales bacterium]|nr:anaerobic ribonucleoside-triphosphate reductase activating protein [Halanaerobiales bacterium]
MIPIIGCQKTSLIDFPGHISSILFTSGCNFRCPYCHNPQLIVNADSPNLKPIPIEIIFEHLTKRKKVLDGVVITGGEPTLHGDKLVELIIQIRELGYHIKLDTNGTNPQLLTRLINENLVDYIAMDLKTCISEYSNLTSTFVNLNLIHESIQILKEISKVSDNSKIINVEFRTTLHPKFHNKEIFHKMVGLIESVPLYVLQTFRPETTLDPLYQDTHPFTEKEMLQFQQIAKNHVNKCLLR